MLFWILAYAYGQYFCCEGEVIFTEPGKRRPAYFFYFTFARKTSCANVELITFERRTLRSLVEFYVGFEDTLFDS